MFTRSLSHSVTWSFSHLVTQSCGHSIIQSLGHFVTWFLGHSVTQSLGHLVTWSFSHSVTRSHSHSVIQSLFSTFILTNYQRDNIRTYRVIYLLDLSRPNFYHFADKAYNRQVKNKVNSISWDGPIRPDLSGHFSPQCRMPRSASQSA